MSSSLLRGFPSSSSPPPSPINDLRRSAPLSTTKNSTWSTQQGIIYHYQDPYYIRGVNFNGVESNCRVFLGLFDHPLSFFLDYLQHHDFNAIRVPIPYEVMNDMEIPIGDCISQEHEVFYPAMTTGDMIHVFLEECYQRNISVLFDLHTIGGVITPLPYTTTVSEDWVIQAWIQFMARVYGHPATMGFELKNEPHNEGGNVYSYHDFIIHCTKIISAIDTYLPDFDQLLFLSGVQLNSSPWGGGYPQSSWIEDMKLLLPYQEKYSFVFCPHVYGTSVRGESVSLENDDTWESNYGFITTVSEDGWNEYPIIPTELGGFLTGSDADYYVRWSDYHIRKKNLIGGFFWWTLGPFSQDTKGLLQEGSYATEEQKLQFILKNTISMT